MKVSTTDEPIQLGRHPFQYETLYTLEPRAKNLPARTQAKLLNLPSLFWMEMGNKQLYHIRPTEQFLLTCRISFSNLSRVSQAIQRSA